MSQLSTSIAAADASYNHGTIRMARYYLGVSDALAIVTKRDSCVILWSTEAKVGNRDCNRQVA